MASQALIHDMTALDLQDDGPPAGLYAVYCVAEIPLEIVTEFIQKTRHEGFPIIITSKDSHLSDYKTSTQLPLDNFVSPFLGYKTEDVVKIHRKQAKGFEDGFCYSCRNLVILDEKTISDKTCLIVDIDNDGDFLTLRSDFEMALDAFMPGEVMSWAFDEMKLAPFFYYGVTITRELFERTMGGERSEYDHLYPEE